MLKHYLLPVLFITVLSVSCTKSSTSSTGTGGGAAFTATINGRAWSASTYSAIIETDINTGAHAISITGVSTTGKASSINLHLENYTGVTGALPITDGGSYTATYGSGSQVNYATSGTVTITSTTGGASGTFSFVADSMNVTSGTFTNVPYH